MFGLVGPYWPVDKDHQGEDEEDVWYEDGKQDGGHCLVPAEVQVWEKIMANH